MSIGMLLERTTFVWYRYGICLFVVFSSACVLSSGHSRDACDISGPSPWDGHSEDDGEGCIAPERPFVLLQVARRVDLDFQSASSHVEGRPSMADGAHMTSRMSALAVSMSSHCRQAMRRAMAAPAGALMWALLILFVGLACLSWLAMANAAHGGRCETPDCAKVPCKPTAEGAATETNA
mmetsp:Transcript_38866/g.111661  ORF Transcript_38866/g.111661 Transcript_38866/m.111661 type:complete len:180 (-) Transcript_38866:109-648(-)